MADPDENENHIVLQAKRLYRKFIRIPVLSFRHYLIRGAGGFESPAWIGVRFDLDEIISACNKCGLIVTKTKGVGTRLMWITATKI